MATTCETCVHFNQQTRRCAAYDMPAELARIRPLLCGDAGSDHSPVSSPLMSPLDWLALALFLLIAAAAITGAILDGSAAAALQQVLS